RTMIHIKSSTYNIDATPAVYTLSLHDALPISSPHPRQVPQESSWRGTQKRPRRGGGGARERRSANQGRGEEVSDGPGGLGDVGRSEEHTSELQSRFDLVCRLLLEKKKKS